MALYSATVLTDSSRPEKPTLLAIAGITGQHLEALKVDRTKKDVGAIEVSFSTIQDDVVASVRSLQNVQTVRKLG